QNSVSKDDVNVFIATFRARAQSNGWTAGIMLSNRPFSQYARAAAASHHDIHLKTVEELHEEILQIPSYLHTHIYRYEQSGLFTDYIPLAALLEDDAAHGQPEPVMKIVDDWLERSKGPQLCLFGDFGTGKTTFLKYLHYSLAK